MFIYKRNSFCLSPDCVICCQLHVPFTTFTLHTSLYRRSIKKNLSAFGESSFGFTAAKIGRIFKKKTVELDNFICISAFMDHSDWNTLLFYDSLALSVFLFCLCFCVSVTFVCTLFTYIACVCLILLLFLWLLFFSIIDATCYLGAFWTWYIFSQLPLSPFNSLLPGHHCRWE